MMVLASDRGKKPIGVKLEIQDDIVFKLKGVERKLAICLPSTCRTVKDVKTYLIKQLFYDHQEIKFFLGDTIREVPDFSHASVFVAFKGSVIRVVQSNKPQRSLATARDSIAISEKRKRIVRFEGDREDPEDTQSGQDIQSTPTPPPSFHSPNNTISRAFSATPIPVTPPPELPWTPSQDSDTCVGFSPITLDVDYSDDDVQRQEEQKGTEERLPQRLTRSAKRRERNRRSILRKSGSTESAEKVQIQSDNIGTEHTSEKENLSQANSPGWNGQEVSYVAMTEKQQQIPEDEVDVSSGLKSSTTRRAAKRASTEPLSPLPVFKQNGQDGLQGGPKRKRKKRHSKSSLPLIQLPTLPENCEDSDSSEDDGLPQWTNRSELPKITINPLGLAKLKLIQSLENNTTFDAMAPHSYAGPPTSFPGIDVQEFVESTIDAAVKQVQLGGGALGNNHALVECSQCTGTLLNPANNEVCELCKKGFSE